MDEMFDPISEGAELSKNVIDVCTMMGILEDSCSDPIVKLAMQSMHNKMHEISAAAMEYLSVIGGMMYRNAHPNYDPQSRNN